MTEQNQMINVKARLDSQNLTRQKKEKPQKKKTNCNDHTQL